jgi:hypothetical protein
MFNIEEILAEYGLTPERYEELLKDCSNKVHKISDLDWSEINAKYGIEFNSDTSRKGSQPPLFGGVFVKEYFDWKSSKEENKNNTSYMDDLAEQRRELERAKIKFRDERNAWQKQNYRDARVESKLDLLEEKLSSIGKTEFENHDGVDINSDNDLLVILSDLHIGQTFSSMWGEYNTNIAKRRLAIYFGEIIKIAKRHNSENCYVSIQGDLISGSIHKSIAITNRENVIEQIKIASQLIASFCYDLSKHFKNIYITNVSGNHSRIDKKEDALHDERLDDLIKWATDILLQHVDNITVSDRMGNFDSGIALMNIRGKDYINVHGDYDSYTKNGVSNLIMMLGFIPYAITFGHMHTCAVDECNGVKMIRGGSLAGSGDSYTIEKRLSGKPSQMVCVCNEKGVEAYYTVELN